MLKIVIVDDDINVCNGLRDLMDWSKLNGEIAGIVHSGEAALELVVNKSPDILISDIKMPGMDGLELCRRIREIRSDIDIILLSAYEDFSFARTAIEYGVRNYILKPINKTKLAELSNIIQQITLNSETQRLLYATIHDTAFENRIIHALKNGNISFFESFFKDEFPALESRNDMIKQWCIKLIDILIDFMTYTGVNTDTCSSSKAKMLQELNSLKLNKDMKFFIEKHYMDVLQFNNEKKINNYLIDDIIEYILKNLRNSDMNVSSIASQFYISPNYTNILFKQAKGINISTYIINERIKRSKELMEDNKLSINEISNLAGFSDPHYFAKVFKKLEGITPSEYCNLKNIKRKYNEVI